jgi:hypothetical protein
MYTSISLNEFRDAFARMGRDNQFSYEALEVLFDYIEDQERDMGEEMELDVIAICCDFMECGLAELVAMYPDILEDEDIEELTDDNEVEVLEYATDYLEYNTQLCGLTPQNTFVFRQF